MLLEDESMYNCFAISNCIIDTFKKKKERDITILALLKYLFFCYGWYLAEHEKELFKGKFTAFPLGPVIKTVYDGFDNSHKNGLYVIKTYKTDDSIPGEIKSFIKKTMAKYLDNNASLELSDITHFPGSPWEQTVKERGFYYDIDASVIKEHFKRLSSENLLC